MTEHTKETSDLQNLHDSTNACLWANEFCKRFPMALSETIGNEGVTFGEDFEGIMIGWFANAIMAGVDSEARKHSDLAAALILAKETLVDMRKRALSTRGEQAYRELPQFIHKKTCAAIDAIGALGVK